jgi:long-chain acyl-CoA synthetase
MSSQRHSLRELLSLHATEEGDKPFLFFPERQETYSYRQVYERCCQFANYLHRIGIQHGDKVAILLPNIPDFVFCYWGAMLIGAVAGPVNTLLKGPEIQYIVDHCQAKVLVTTPEFYFEVNRIMGDLPNVAHYVTVADTCEASQQAEEDVLWVANSTAIEDIWATEPTTLPEASVLPDDEAMIIYTSGTTGKPKGVLLTPHNLIIDATYIRDWFNLTPGTRFMNILPLFHVNGEVVTLMTPWVSRGAVVLNRRFKASTFWQTIHDYQVNLFSTVPTILSILIQQGKPTVSYDTLKFGICGAAPLPVEVHKNFEATFNVPIYEGYGLSETTCYSTFNPPDPNRRKIGSIGQAVGNEVAIWDENNQPVPVGEGGEIVVRGENVMRGYFLNPEATSKAFAGGWFHSGDWGRMDEDGFFYILDRVKDMIIRGGENIYPREIDEVLYTHSCVEAAATIGVPDPKYGEEVISFVVVKSGTTVTEEELIAFCQAHLADFKCPKGVRFVKEIPKGPTGKLLRRVLREMYAE